MSDPSALEFSGIYDAFHARVLRYVARLIGPGEADDVTQEVFAKVARSLGTLADPSKLGSWIYAITLNTIRDVTRERASRTDRAPTGPGASGGAGAEDTPFPQTPDSRARTPEEIAIRNEMVACYLDFVDQLPPDYREAYVLSEFEGLSNADIALRISVSVGAVKIRLHRARARVTEELRRNCRCYYNERGELMAEPKYR